MDIRFLFSLKNFRKLRKYTLNIRKPSRIFTESIKYGNKMRKIRKFTFIK